MLRQHRHNYLRSERRRSGLSQTDVARVLGSKLLSVHRYEKGERLPPLEIALAYEAMFGKPIATLFAYEYRQAKTRVRLRSRQIAKHPGHEHEAQRLAAEQIRFRNGDAAIAIGDKRAIVAIEPTHEGIAFVNFEGGVLREWGTRVRGRRSDLVLVEEVISQCGAEIVVMENPDARGCRRRPRVRALQRAIRDHGWGRRVRVRMLEREQVRSGWARRGRTNKQAVATELAALYPELKSIVPPPRKITMSEDPRVKIFDALSLAVHAFPPSVAHIVR